MPAGLFIKHPYTVYLDPQQSFEITENGIYTIIPANDTYGTLIVFQSFGGAGGIVQFYAHPFGNGIYRFRIKTSNNKNEWSEWKNF